MGIPQTMKTMGIYKSFVLNPEASDVSDTFLGFFFRVLIVLQVETVAQYPLQRNQIREANIFWKPGFGYMGSSYFSLSLFFGLICFVYWAGEIQQRPSTAIPSWPPVSFVDHSIFSVDFCFAHQHFTRKKIWGNMQVHLSACMHVQAVASETLLLPQ
jgi:hypothetical protein